MLDLQFRYFLICAEEKSFTKASGRIGISQSALSQQISRLEKFLGIELFDRLGRGIQLTNSGSKVFSNLQPLYNTIDTSVKEIQLQEGIHQGTIAVAGVHSILPYLLPRLISDYSNSFKNIGFKLYTRNSQQVIQLAFNRTVDFGLVYQNQGIPPELDVDPLYNEELSIIFSENSIYANEILENKRLPEKAPLVLFPPGFTLRNVVDTAFIREKLNIVIEVETTDMLLNLVANNAGISFLPRHVVANSPRIKHARLKDINLNVGMVMISRYRKTIQPIGRMFIDKIKEECSSTTVT